MKDWADILVAMPVHNFGNCHGCQIVYSHLGFSLNMKQYTYMAKMPVFIRFLKRFRRMLLSYIIFVVIAGSGILLVLYAWDLFPFTSFWQSTEDAYLRGNVTVISPQINGYIVNVPVQDFQWVHKGELLAKVDQRIYIQHVEQATAVYDSKVAALENSQQQERIARATIEQAIAELEFTKAQSLKSAADLHRVVSLVNGGAVSIREQDQAVADNHQAVASQQQKAAGIKIAEENLRSVLVNRKALMADIESAKATLELARIDLTNTEILAPDDGQLGQIGVRLGAYVNAGTQLMSLVPKKLWIIANMKETQMGNVRVGQPVRFTVDALNNAEFHGRVSRISPATGAQFSAIASDNATGNFVKVVQRIPIRVSIDPDQKNFDSLRVGMSMLVSIDTRATINSTLAASAARRF